MISIEVLYLPPLKQVTQKSGEKVLLKERGTLLELLNQLSAGYGAGFEKKVLSQENNLNPYMAVLINGQGISKDKLDIELKEGDSIIIGMLMGGG